MLISSCTRDEVVVWLVSMSAVISTVLRDSVNVSWDNCEMTRRSGLSTTSGKIEGYLINVDVIANNLFGYNGCGLPIPFICIVQSINYHKPSRFNSRRVQMA